MVGRERRKHYRGKSSASRDIRIRLENRIAFYYSACAAWRKILGGAFSARSLLFKFWQLRRFWQSI